MVVRKMSRCRFSSISFCSSSIDRDADVEVAVGGEDHAVVAVLDEVLLAPLCTPARSRRAPAVEPPACRRVERGEDRRLVGAGGRRQHDARRAGVDDDGHACPRRAAGRRAGGSADLISGSRSGGCHRAGDVEQEDEVVRRHLPLVEIAAPGCRCAAGGASVFHGQPATSVVMENGSSVRPAAGSGS